MWSAAVFHKYITGQLGISERISMFITNTSDFIIILGTIRYSKMCKLFSSETLVTEREMTKVKLSDLS